MNKQQLANKIWEAANKMRSKIEASEYKDYILGFMFYKYLSDCEVKFLKENDYDDDTIKEVNEDDEETLEFVQDNLGYFISYDNLFSTWIAKGKDFQVDDVMTALSAFSRQIGKEHKKVFENVFQTLETGLNKLGESSGARTKAIRALIILIEDIPMEGKQGYDVLGFVYEYLISMFAANAGKKAGEFYTPNEVSVLMSEIVAYHLKGKSEIKIYDPTSGSGSLLINIGEAVANYMDDSNNIKYYAQELKENTYNLTRMNLVMRGIKASNILARNGDTLEEDWPYFDESDPEASYDPLYVDAVVSNPPYSQVWDPANKENDPRYSRFGLAPRTKADYAFLLHDLYHIKPDGIMTIVLPHGVLFRGGEEGTIRENLIENNHIDCIIGLPSNIFFGTGIPTIIMVLRQKRENTDVLIIDASKGFTKEGKNNKLRSSDIRKIVDCVQHRQDIPNFSRCVSKGEIAKNDYNLNIPRYVDTSEKAETFDIYSSMFGGIPVDELEELGEYWSAFPDVWKDIFREDGSPYVSLACEDLKTALETHPNILAFHHQLKTAFDGFDSELSEKLVENWENISLKQEKTNLATSIFKRLDTVVLLDKYKGYQILSDHWVRISEDLEMMQTEGFSATKKVDSNMVMKKKDGKEVVVQDGYKGHILPFDLVQSVHLTAALEELTKKEAELSTIPSKFEELIESLTEEEKESSILNDDNSAFTKKEVEKHYKDLISTIQTPEISQCHAYLQYGKKADKVHFIEAHPEVQWSQMEAAKDGTYSKTTVNKYISQLIDTCKFSEDSIEYKLQTALSLLEQEKSLKKEIKDQTLALQEKTKEVIESLTDEQAKELLHLKWISPYLTETLALSQMKTEEFLGKLEHLAKKYAVTLKETQEEIKKSEQALCSMIDQLTGSDFDMKGLAELKNLLGGG